MGAPVVVVVGEGVEQGLEAGEGGGLVGWGGQPVFEGLVEVSRVKNLAQIPGLRV
jgi:hypothetical protein